jgi:hypothetical protein
MGFICAELLMLTETTVGALGRVRTKVLSSAILTAGIPRIQYLVFYLDN